MKQLKSLFTAVLQVSFGPAAPAASYALPTKIRAKVSVAEAQSDWQSGWNLDNPPPIAGWYEIRCKEYETELAHYFWDGEVWRVSGPPESPVENNGRATLSGHAEYRGPVPFQRAWRS